jgi:thiamine biosynthesis lipoprotein ApbE
MGMPITVDIVDCDEKSVFEAVFTRFREIDGRFSTYKPDSEVSRFRDRRVTEGSLSDELKMVIAQCKICQIGIQDPKNKTKILNKLSITNGAVATSGNYERGTHIINPKTKKPASELLSVTVSGPDIIKADILATACFAMGSKAAQFMKSQKGYQAIILAAAHRL